jgi:hypothetical protein
MGNLLKMQLATWARLSCILAHLYKIKHKAIITAAEFSELLPRSAPTLPGNGLKHVNFFNFKRLRE